MWLPPRTPFKSPVNLIAWVFDPLVPDIGVAVFDADINESEDALGAVIYVGGGPIFWDDFAIGARLLQCTFADIFSGSPTERFRAGDDLQQFALPGTQIVTPLEWTWFGTLPPESLMLIAAARRPVMTKGK